MTQTLEAYLSSFGIPLFPTPVPVPVREIPTGSMVLFTTFVNCRICIDGEIIEGNQLVVSPETGNIIKRKGYIGGDIVDLDDNIIAPGFLELQTNGRLGFHFTDFQSDQQYELELRKVAKHLVTKGVTGFWATVPTVEESVYKKVRIYFVKSSETGFDLGPPQI